MRHRHQDGYQFGGNGSVECVGQGDGNGIREAWRRHGAGGGRPEASRPDYRRHKLQQPLAKRLDTGGRAGLRWDVCRTGSAPRGACPRRNRVPVPTGAGIRGEVCLSPLGQAHRSTP
ncbi:hypothetical protein AZ22_4351 [Bordetella bronchiseptica 980-2]|nr:hypothetical protein AZ22_4351 [Bordetella bronchiseptica 980-2]KCV48313.1 hypothetical protein L491_4398 [Bordetella bronchiseptica 3E44]KCV58543.1 hypothetical protein AZ14_4459 [Bordetella bronchiseptica 980]KDB57851.1 hypothetical protein AZ16_4328 [Bordetella bronchiseptica B18-5 (C3)]KDB85053.1 hypothetical protein AZ27_4279 [Bordetella bronchiseptica D756]KDB90594.1 hypothetical protein AZ17_4500 [Bordetella bronchiseptica D989]KDB95776.1 hypothetical protein AZ23_4366 [Bordetella b